MNDSNDRTDSALWRRPQAWRTFGVPLGAVV